LRVLWLSCLNFLFKMNPCLANCQIELYLSCGWYAWYDLLNNLSKLSINAIVYLCLLLTVDIKERFILHVLLLLFSYFQKTAVLLNTLLIKLLRRGNKTRRLSFLSRSRDHQAFLLHKFIQDMIFVRLQPRNIDHYFRL